MARPDLLAALPQGRGMMRYLLEGEQIVIAAHQHWAKVAEPVASAAGGLVLVVALDAFLPAGLGFVANVLWWAWFALVTRAIWKILERRHDWFVATDKRLILTYGLITTKVAMMPLTKVTDMSYNRSPLGRLLGYGTFVMESAGQDQALRRVSWVADPDHTYRAMCAEIFGVEADAPELPEADGYVPQHSRRVGTSGLPNRPDTGDYPAGNQSGGDYSRAIRIRSPGSQPVTSTTSEATADTTGEPDIHDAETGPIPY